MLRTCVVLLLTAWAVAAEPFPREMPLDGGDSVLDLSPGRPVGA